MPPRALTAALLLTATTMLAGCVPPGIACPAIGFVYADPVILEIDPDILADGTVAVCLGGECEPAPLTPTTDEQWQVPQEPPYAPDNVLGLNAGDSVRIVITDSSGDVILDESREIPYTAQGGRCPGPIEFQPVVIP